MKEALSPGPFLGMCFVGTEGNLGLSNAFISMPIEGVIGSWPVASLCVSPHGDTYGVGLDGQFKWWNSLADEWSAGGARPEDGGGLVAPINWRFDDAPAVQACWSPDGTKWAVDGNGRVGRAGNDVTPFGGWTVRMLSFDQQGNIWGVGTDGNLGKLQNDGTFADVTVEYDSWAFNVFTFDPSGNAWCIGTDGNVGQWDGENGRMIDHGLVMGWTMRWLYWPPLGTFIFP